MKLRAPKLDDIPKLAALHLNCWQVAYRGVCDQGWLDSLKVEDFDSYHRPNIPPKVEQPFFVAVDDDDCEIIGFARGGPTRAKSPMNDELPTELLADYSSELYALYVHPDFQKRGIGVAMLDAIVSALGEQGHHAMCLWVMTANVKAQRFYAARGGVPIGNARLTFSGSQYDMTAFGWDKLKV
jgi:GNAT superfamily N-acetyltransferase